ncbi:MAG: FHA domain-containing protein [Verrucomicrobiota bacterium]
MPILVVSLPDGTEINHDLAQGLITIGRVADADIQIDDPSISIRHAELTRRGKDYYLRDVGSTNGTDVNGEAISQPKKLTSGDTLRFGNICAIYEPLSQSGSISLPEENPEASKPAASSQRPEDFGNASPFQRKRVEKNMANAVAVAFFALGFIGFGIVAFLTVMLEAPKF